VNRPYIAQSLLRRFSESSEANMGVVSRLVERSKSADKASCPGLKLSDTSDWYWRQVIELERAALQLAE
jgi:hypothetical protein